MSETIKLLNLIRSIISVIDKSMTIRKVSFTMLRGLSIDTKPLFGQDVGDMFMEMDTGNLFIYNSGTWNNLTANATPLTFSGTTFNVDTNTLQDSTTNAQGDILSYQTDSYQRLARGTSGQILGVNAGATDIAYIALTSGHLPSTIAYNDISNTFTSGQTMNDYLDLRLSVSGAPASGWVRFFANELDSDNHRLYVNLLVSGSTLAVRLV